MFCYGKIQKNIQNYIYKKWKLDILSTIPHAHLRADICTCRSRNKGRSTYSHTNPPHTYTHTHIHAHTHTHIIKIEETFFYLGFSFIFYFRLLLQKLFPIKSHDTLSSNVWDYREQSKFTGNVTWNVWWLREPCTDKQTLSMNIHGNIYSTSTQYWHGWYTHRQTTYVYVCFLILRYNKPIDIKRAGEIVIPFLKVSFEKRDYFLTSAFEEENTHLSFTSGCLDTMAG